MAPDAVVQQALRHTSLETAEQVRQAVENTNKQTVYGHSQSVTNVGRALAPADESKLNHGRLFAVSYEIFRLTSFAFVC